MSGVIYPVNNKKYTAEDVEIFNCTRTSGVYTVLDFDCSLNGNVITIGKGLAWIKNGDFTGKALAFKEPETLTLDGADSTNDRYDVVAVRYDASKAEPELVVIKGEAEAEPVIPTRSKETYLYELFLYAILRKAGESSASIENLIDLRTNETFCGLMRDSVTSAVVPAYDTIFDIIEFNSPSLYSGATLDFDYEKYQYLIADVGNTIASCGIVLPLQTGSGTNFAFSGSNFCVKQQQIGEPVTIYFRMQVDLTEKSDNGHVISLLEWSNTPDFSSKSNARLDRLIGVTKQPEGYVKVDSVYNPESHNAQSGEAVKQAIDEALENFGGGGDIEVPENVETTDNKVTAIDENSTDEQYPSAKAVYDALLAQAIDIKVEPLGESEEAPEYGGDENVTPATFAMRSVPSENTADTKVTLTVTDGKLMDIRNIYRQENYGGVTHIDWGDGSSTDIVGVTDDEMKHTYTTGGTYTITLVGAEILTAFNEKGVTNLVIGSTVTSILSGSFINNPNLTEIIVYAETPPTINGASTTSFVFGNQVTKITVPNNEYSSVLGWSIYADKIIVDSSLNGGGTGGEEGDVPGGDVGGDDDDDGGNGGNTDVVSGSGYKLIITTSEGVKTLYLYQGQNGKDGKDGTNGKDGFSPTIEVEKIEGGNRLIITDKNGTQTVDVKGGAQLDNTADTKVTLSVADNYTLKLTNIYNYDNYGGVTYVDWGDGAFTDTTKGTLSDIEHKYTKGGTYTVTLVGLTHLPALTFRAKPVVGVEIGSIVRYMGKMAFNECYDLTEARIYADVPPDLELLSSGIGAFDLTVKKIVVPTNSMYAYSKAVKWSKYASAITADEFIGNVFADKVVTVGEGGDFPTINDALNYLSMFYPLYKAKGIKCEIQILDGTIINEQVWVERIDLSYISITTNNPNNTVQVDVTGWTGVTHDTRNNRPFFSGENGARLPAIKCLFSCIVPTGGWVTGVSTEADNVAVGYFCNRGSTGVICGEAIYEGSIAVGIENVGFENFYDNIIANNNSEIVLREAIARNAGRYGVMARHISRVSARSANITNCGQVAKNGECAGAYADRSSMMDVRFADVSGSYNGLQCFNTSNMTAVETIAKNITNIVADSREGSVINCAEMTIDTVKDVFKVLNGGTIIATSTAPTNVSGTLNSKERNTVDINGIIYG